MIDAADEWTNPETGDQYNDIYTPVWRWRRAFYNDFVCRMDWCQKPYRLANHHPKAALDGDRSDTIVRLVAKAGEVVTLDASASNDPDEDLLQFLWYVYPEAGTYPGSPVIKNKTNAVAQIVIPKDAAGKQIHVILQVSDENKIASLYDYRRIVIDVQEPIVREDSEVELKNVIESDSDRMIKALAGHNRAVHILDDWMRDPYIVLAPDGWYYLTCTRLNHIDGGRESIQLWRSRDLAKWEDRGVLWTFDDSRWIRPLATQAQKEKGKAHLWAPEFHLLDGRWIAVHTTSFHRANLLMNQSPDLKGPFKEPMAADFGHHHDPSIFTDDDGTHWLVWACAATAPLNPDMSQNTGSIRLKPRPSTNRV